MEIPPENGEIPVVSGDVAPEPDEDTTIQSAPVAAVLPEVKESSSDVVVSYTAIIAKGDFTLDNLPWGYPGYAFRYMTNDYTGQKNRGYQGITERSLRFGCTERGKAGMGR